MIFEQALRTFEHALDCLREARVKSVEALSLSKASRKMASNVFAERVKL